MSCIYDIYEAFKDLFVDCIFCTEKEKPVSKPKRSHKKYKDKATQTYPQIEELKEPGS